MDETNLRQQLLITQFINICGGTREQAIHLMTEANWNFDGALSLFFREVQICPPPTQNNNFQPFTPRNTPATPPNFPETLELFHKLRTSESIQQPQAVPEDAQLKS